MKEKLANRQHFQIFPNSQRDWKLRWLSAEKELSDEQEGMKVGSWIFNPLRTVNLNIFFNLVEWIFYHFRRVDTDVSKNWMIMVMINWFKLLGPTEKTSPNFFISKVILSDLSHWVVLQNYHWVWELSSVLDFWRDLLYSFKFLLEL